MSINWYLVKKKQHFFRPEMLVAIFLKNRNLKKKNSDTHVCERIIENRCFLEKFRSLKIVILSKGF